MHTPTASGDGQSPSEEATCPCCGQEIGAYDYGLDGSAIYYCRADDKIWVYRSSTGERIILERHQS